MSVLDRQEPPEPWTLAEVMEHFGLDDGDLIAPPEEWSADEKAWDAEAEQS